MKHNLHKIGEGASTTMTLARAQAPPIRRSRAARRSPSTRHFVPLIMAGVAVVSTVIASDWIAGASIAVLWLIWFLLSEDGGMPVLPLAMSFQWFQVTCGVFYLAFTGRELVAHYASDYRPMVLIGLGCVVATSVGLAIGMKVVRRRIVTVADASSFTVSWRTMMLAYVGTSIASALLREIAWSVPGLAQAILALGFIRLGVLFLIFRRLVRHHFRWEWFFGFLVVELMLGFTGYFAGFREPLMLAALAILEVFRPRSVTHWLRIVAVAALMGAAGLMWIGIRTVYRSEINAGELGGSRVERLERIGELSSDWLDSESTLVADDMDQLIDRMWAIYYPALALSRVPDVLPHEDGAILRAAVMHIVTPRILFPGKGVLPSDSEMVRKYSGIFVASTEEGTSIAFGYAAESYIDFGLPWMFVPSLLFGIAAGAAYRFVFRVIRHHELAVGLASVVFWLGLYLFERSWIKTLGLSLTLLIAVGALVVILDRALTRRSTSPRYRLRSLARRNA